MNFPKDLKYTSSDEWVRVEGTLATIGISDFAQDQLSDIVYLEFVVSEGDEVKKGDTLGTIESVKAASDIYFPVSGKVVKTNDGLLDNPEKVNTDPYGAAWMIQVELSDTAEADAMLNVAAYEADTKGRA
jgi:glycine cleavage system H protein